MRRRLARWLRRPSRVPRGLRWTVAVAMGSLALIGIAAPAPGEAGYPATGPGGPAPNIAIPPNKTPLPPGPHDLIARFPSSPQLHAEGKVLYEQHCSSCHGLGLNGIRGVAPSLRDVGPGPVDFYLSTGRMPIQNPRDEPLRARPLFNRRQIDALIDYVSSFGGPPASYANPARGNLSYGRHAFTDHCAGCHQMVARGGIFAGAFVPDLEAATSQQVADAVRMGPYLMPHFDYHQIDQHTLDSIAAYVRWTQHPNNAGGWPIDNIGPIPEGLVAWFLGLGALLIVARLIGERIDERPGSHTPSAS